MPHTECTFSHYLPSHSVHGEMHMNIWLWISLGPPPSHPSDSLSDTRHARCLLRGQLQSVGVYWVQVPRVPEDKRSLLAAPQLPTPDDGGRRSCRGRGSLSSGQPLRGTPRSRHNSSSWPPCKGPIPQDTTLFYK